MPLLCRWWLPLWNHLSPFLSPPTETKEGPNAQRSCQGPIRARSKLFFLIPKFAKFQQ
jgi:hypothetical protein